MIRTRFVRSLVVLAVLAAALAVGPTAFAFYNYTYEITGHASGGQTFERICTFYDNETGEVQGTVSAELQC